MKIGMARAEGGVRALQATDGAKLEARHDGDEAMKIAKLLTLQRGSYLHKFSHHLHTPRKIRLIENFFGHPKCNLGIMQDISKCEREGRAHMM